MQKITDSLKYKVYAIVTAGIVMTAVIIMFGFSVFTHFETTHGYWESYIQKEASIANALAILNQNIGYGGFIHNFKNLVLRRDLERYRGVIEYNISQLNYQLDKIEGLVSSDEEKAALRQLHKTFDEYEAKFQIAKELIMKNKSTEEIDTVVKVSDTAALAAIRTLSLKTRQRAHEVERTTLHQEVSALHVLQFGGLLIIVFIVSMLTFLIVFLYRLRSANDSLIIEKQKAEQASLEKSHFLASMSHDLRTPLNAILGFSQILQMNCTEDEANEHLSAIINAGNSLLEIIDQLLDISKIEAGVLSLSIDSWELKGLLENSLSTISHIAAKNGITIDCKIDTTAILSVDVDKARFQEVLLNLLTNAIKYNEENGRITIDYMIGTDNMLCLLITDTGKGITPEQQQRIFKRFERAGAENSNIPGTGLGLAIAKDLIEKMQGRIGFESEVGKGSCFWLKVPLSKTVPTEVRTK